MQLVSGALNPISKEANRHAIEYYESVRKQTTDCEQIAINTGYSYEQIALVKAYIFYAQHDLSDGKQRFYPCFEMATSWQRLRSKDKRHIQPHDLLLLQHELLEISYVLNGYTQDKAHTLASAVYNYVDVYEEFYARQGFSY